VDSIELLQPNVYATGFCINGTGIVNDLIADELTATETNSDGEEIYSLNLVQLFRPYSATASNEDADIGIAECTTASPPVCEEGTDGSGNPLPLVMTTYDSAQSGNCFDPVPGTPVPGGANSPAAPCFETTPTTVTIDVAGIPIELSNASVAGAYDSGNPPSSLSDGLIAGFISESTAEGIIIPDDVDFVGGQTLASVLPGGSGSCQGNDGTLISNGPGGDSGWWFYLDLAATAVDWQGN
jgi:hypothetical protein